MSSEVKGQRVPYYKIKAEFVMRSENPLLARQRASALLNEPGRRIAKSIFVDSDPIPHPRHEQEAGPTIGD